MSTAARGMAHLQTADCHGGQVHRHLINCWFRCVTFDPRQQQSVRRLWQNDAFSLANGP